MTESQQHHGEEQPAGPTLDERGQALQQLLVDTLAALQVEVDASLDEVVVKADAKNIPEICRICREDPRLDMNYLRSLAVVDYVEYLQVVYLLYSLDKKHKCIIKTDVPNDNPVVPSITAIYPSANWHEREGAELFGVNFDGHPELKPLLLYEGFEGYPGRKSFPFHDYDEW